MTEQVKQEVTNELPKELLQGTKPTQEKVAAPVNTFLGTDVTDETRTLDRVQFPVEDYYKEYKAGQRPNPWSVGYISDIKTVAYIRKDDWVLLPGEILAEGAKKPEINQVTEESKRYVLEFEFVSKDGVSSFIHVLWSIDEGDEKAAGKRKGINQFLSHLWTALTLRQDHATYLSSKALSEVLGKPITSWKENFDAIAKQFKTARNGNPVYTNIDNQPLLLRLKIVYDKRGNTVFPMYGNKVERIVAGIATSTLSVETGDIFVKPVKSSEDEYQTAQKPVAEEDPWA